MGCLCLDYLEFTSLRVEQNKAFARGKTGVGIIVAGLNHAMHSIDIDDNSLLEGDGPGSKKGNEAGRNPKQDKKLSPGEIKKLKDAGWDHADKGVNGKGGGPKDLWKDKNGNVYEKPKSGSGPGEPIGVNLNNLSVSATVIGVGTAVIYTGIKLLHWAASRTMPLLMATPLMMQQLNPNYQYQRTQWQ